MRQRFLILAVLMVVGLTGVACRSTTVNAPTNGTVNQTTINATVEPSSNLNVPILNANNSSLTNANVNAGTTEPMSVSIDITVQGFSPATATVRVGGTVTWTNRDTVRHWPAVDPHPAHTDLPGFDAIGGIDQGEQYSFTFQKIGTYTYHDHLFPLRTGSVVVR